MLQSIGQIGSRASVFPAATFGQTGQSQSVAVGLGSLGKEDQRAHPMFDTEDAEPLRVGFGQGTVSGPTAAVTALDKGMNGARELMRKAEELRQRQRDRREVNEARSAEFRRVERRRLDPAAQGRNFINSLNEAAGVAAARLSGEEPESTEQTPTITINGQTIAYRQPASGITLDVRA